MAFPLSDIEDACKRIGLMPRAAFEKSLPDIGSIIEEVERLGKMRRTTGVEQPKIHIWQCGACDTTQASEKAENCHKCGNGYLGMHKLTDNSHQGWSAVDAKKHFERFRSNPEEFFLLDSLLPDLKKRRANEQL